MPTIENRHTAQGTRYRVKVRLTGARPLSRTFPTRQQARHWAVTTEHAVLSHAGPMPEALRYTLADAIARYRKEMLPRLSPGTQHNRAIHLNWWHADLGYLRLVDVTPGRLVECREKLSQCRSAGTVNQYLLTLGHALAVAVREWEWLEASPMRRVQKLRLPPPRNRYLSDDERQRLLAACRTSSNRLLYPIVMLALATGARKMELLTLTWADVDLRRREVLFRHTKSRTPRVAPLADPALTLLQDHAKVRRLDTPFVFARRDGHKPVDLRYSWQRALHQAEITDFVFHDLRHTFASYSAMTGASSLDLQALLGHKTAAMTARYAHLSQAHLEAVVTKMSATFF